MYEMLTTHVGQKLTPVLGIGNPHPRKFLLKYVKRILKVKPSFKGTKFTKMESRFKNQNLSLPPPSKILGSTPVFEPFSLFITFSTVKYCNLSFE
jgi:hypothetical protein